MNAGQLSVSRQPVQHRVLQRTTVGRSRRWSGRTPPRSGREVYSVSQNTYPKAGTYSLPSRQNWHWLQDPAIHLIPTTTRSAWPAEPHPRSYAEELTLLTELESAQRIIDRDDDAGPFMSHASVSGFRQRDGTCENLPQMQGRPALSGQLRASARGILSQGLDSLVLHDMQVGLSISTRRSGLNNGLTWQTPE